MNKIKRTSNKYAAQKGDVKAAKSDLKNEIRKGRRHGYTKKEEGEKPNDLSWHAKSAQLLHDSAAIPWSWATGKPIKRDSLVSNNYASTYITPGIEVIRTILTPGCGDKGTDPINLAAQALYTDIRRELKSANAYEGSDVIIYLLAVAEILAFISWLTRIYATLMCYSFGNRYMPDALLRAQGVDYNDLKSHPAEFRGALNQTIAKASQIWIPKGFDFLSRAKWEYSNYYSEGEDVKDQIYMLAPALFRKFVYDETADYAGSLRPFFYVTGMHQEHLYTGDELIAALNEMIDALVGDTDFQNIAGDLFNRYGAGGVETFSLIPDGAIIAPVFSIEVLEQFKNAKCVYPIHYAMYEMSETDRERFFRISQDESVNRLIIPKTVAISETDAATARNYSIADCLTPILSVHDSPNEGKTMTITRMTNVITGYSRNVSQQMATFTMDCSADWVVGFEFITFTDDQLANLIMFASTGILPPIGTEGFSEEYVAAASSFHYRPLMFRMTGATNVSPFAYGEQDIVAPISPVQLQDLNRVDLLSLFAVPDVGSVVK